MEIRPSGCGGQPERGTIASTPWAGHRLGGGSLMVWGCMSYDKLFPLIRISTTLNARGYVDLLRSFFDAHHPGRPSQRSEATPYADWAFQHDNAAVHTAGVVEEFLKARKIQVMPWPPCSPDLNPIENLWGILTRRVYDRAAYPTADALWARVQQEWAQIGRDTLHRLYDSMPRRVEGVLRQRGYSTPY